MTKTIQIRLGGVVLLALIIAIIFGVFKYRRDTQRLTSDLLEAEEKVDYYTVVVGNLTEQVAEAKLWVWAKEQALVLTESQVERLRKQNIDHVAAIGRLNVRIAVLQDSLTLKRGTDTIKVVEYVNESGERNDCVPIPFSFDFDDDWAYIYGAVDASGSGDLGFFLKETPVNITLGSKGVFQKEQVVAISSANPYLMITPQDFQIVQKGNKKAPILIGTGAYLAGILTMVLLGR